MKQKEKEDQFLPDVDYEGRDQMYMDIDRMINEGMAGGTVHMREERTNIDEVIDIYEEDPPNK